MSVLADVVLLAVVVAVAVVTRSTGLYYLAGAMFLVALFVPRRRRRHR